jgi:hypothetical protein
MCLSARTDLRVDLHALCQAGKHHRDSGCIGLFRQVDSNPFLPLINIIFIVCALDLLCSPLLVNPTGEPHIEKKT